MSIEVVDMTQPNAGEVLLRSLKNTGFAVLKNHSVDKALLDQFYGEWAKFFAKSNEEKAKNQTKHGGGEGWFPLKSENAKGYDIKDVKEFYHTFYPFTPGEGYPGTISQVVACRLCMLGEEVLFMIQDELPNRILRPFQGQGSLPYLARYSHSTLLRVLHYPPLDGTEEPGAVRAAAHGDINLITLLPAATAPGLQVQDREGNWHEVKCDPGMIVMNVGDMLEELTGGYLKSTVHRVVNPTDGSEKSSRYSAPLFIHPRPDVRLSSRYTAQEYLDQRLKEIGLKK